MTNAEWCIKNGYKFQKLTAEKESPEVWRIMFIEQVPFQVSNNRHVIGTILCNSLTVSGNMALKVWLDEGHKESVLTEEEKEYLATVIKPFRKRITTAYIDDSRTIHFLDNCFMIAKLPTKEGSFKDWETRHAYTLQELGL